jgi:hypothetical protein
MSGIGSVFGGQRNSSPAAAKSRVYATPDDFDHSNIWERIESSLDRPFQERRFQMPIIPGLEASNMNGTSTNQGSSMTANGTKSRSIATLPSMEPVVLQHSPTQHDSFSEMAIGIQAVPKQPQKSKWQIFPSNPFSPSLPADIRDYQGGGVGSPNKKWSGSDGMRQLSTAGANGTNGSQRWPKSAAAADAGDALRFRHQQTDSEFRCD